MISTIDSLLLPFNQELTVDSFIPNDTYVADGSRVALITGANCSGKSVYLKQVPQVCSAHRSIRGPLLDVPPFDGNAQKRCTDKRGSSLLYSIQQLFP